MRKFWFAYLAKALVIFPAASARCDELFEILTLVQTDKLSKKIGVILYGRDYWDQVLNLKPMAEWGAIAEKDIELLHYADTPADAFEQLRRHLEEHHIEPDKPARRPASRPRAVTRAGRHEPLRTQSTRRNPYLRSLRAMGKYHRMDRDAKEAHRSIQGRLSGGR